MTVLSFLYIYLHPPLKKKKKQSPPSEAGRMRLRMLVALVRWDTDCCMRRPVSRITNQPSEQWVPGRDGRRRGRGGRVQMRRWGSFHWKRQKELREGEEEEEEEEGTGGNRGGGGGVAESVSAGERVVLQWKQCKEDCSFWCWWGKQPREGINAL